MASNGKIGTKYKNSRVDVQRPLAKASVSDAKETPTENGQKKMGFEDFSVTHQKILRVLHDGLDHHRDELLQCLPDPDMSTYKNLNDHITLIRTKLKAVKQDIVCVHPKMQVHYRWVRLRGYLEEF